MIKTFVPIEASQTVSSVVALLVRFPEISSIWSHPTDGTIRLTYAVSRRLSRDDQRSLAQAFDEYIRGFVELEGRDVRTLTVRSENDAYSFVHVTRDAASFTREELDLHIGLLAARFGETLVRNPATDEMVDEDAAADDDMVDRAIDSMRDPAQKKSLVGYREEKRVLVYFLNARKAKARR